MLLIAFGGQVLLEPVILVIGSWRANLARSAVLRADGDSAAALADILRVTISGLMLAMVSRAMDIADDIVSLAFGLILGAVALTVFFAWAIERRQASIWSTGSRVLERNSKNASDRYTRRVLLRSVAINDS